MNTSLYSETQVTERIRGGRKPTHLTSANISIRHLEKLSV